MSGSSHRRRTETPPSAPGLTAYIRTLSAITQPGDLFYDPEFGWGLYDFIQSEDSELTRLEITQRARSKLQKREVILPDSIEISIDFNDDVILLRCSFRFGEESEARKLNVVIGAVSVEVIAA